MYSTCKVHQESREKVLLLDKTILRPVRVKVLLVKTIYSNRNPSANTT